MYSEYFALPETMQPQNLIEGRLYVSPSPLPAHNDLAFDIASAIRDYRREHGGYVVLAPMDCRLGDRTVLQPDVMYLTEEHKSLRGKKRIEGAPDLVVEVLSPSTAARLKRNPLWPRSWPPADTSGPNCATAWAYAMCRSLPSPSTARRS